jgi:hypothetical protein
MPATSPRLKSATYKLFPPRRVSKEVTPPLAPQRTAFSLGTDHKSLPGGVGFLAHSVGSVPPWQAHPYLLSPLECAFTRNRPLTEPCALSVRGNFDFTCPLFSYSYELLFPQLFCFHNDPHCPGAVAPVKAALLYPKEWSRCGLRC